ncbi:uncharacterized protein LOC129570761 [Sitodiplosis mosellana]|uniref:uncharacterized protein LOC129570761 n=1 Tax=Sitodiplosis mosellana TaxID=263140 RepID=UPI0024443743|nr:uncharacterized protein LOC129570761 [Sitodiplosis mosellana]
MNHTTEEIKALTSKSEDQQSNGSAITRPSNKESSPKIFKLTIDCFDEIFEYLSLKDLHSFGQTCKTMQKVAGEYFKQNYSAAEKFCAKDGIYTIYSDSESVIDERIWISYFNQSMPCISHHFERLDPLRYLRSHIDEFKSIKHICFVSLNLNREKVQFIQKILPKIEVVQIKNGHATGNLHELMLKYCDNLKKIYVQNSDSSFNGKFEWLLADYPHLSHLELIPNHLHVIEELSEFFTRNPKVQRFSTSGVFLWANRNELVKTKAKLNILEIKSNHFLGYGDSIWDLLKQLHSQGFYKRLFLYTDGVNQDLSIKLASLPNLETLCVRWFSGNYNLTCLTNLKELILLDGLNVADAEILANGLVKLERLYVDKATVEDILPFIRQSAKLNKLKMLPKDEKDSEEDATPIYYNYYDYYNDEDSDDESENDEQEKIHAGGEGKSGDKVENQVENKNDSEIRDENRIHNGDCFSAEEKPSNDDNDGDNIDQNDGPKAEANMENIAGNSNSKSNSIDNSIAHKNLDDGQDDGQLNSFSNGRVLNLVALNKERGKLPNARKVTIYVRDDVFLATKWATKNGDTHLKYIEMKRSDSYEWNHHY